MQLTEHFSDAELGVCGCSEQLIAQATFLCESILEPVRKQFGPVAVHDGYRDVEHNARVGGKVTSFHLFADGRAAADISVPGFACPDLFDWIRLESGLPFDKAILETDAAGFAATVHLQVDMGNRPRRLAYTGSTGAGTAYVPAEVR